MEAHKMLVINYSFEKRPPIKPSVREDYHKNHGHKIPVRDSNNTNNQNKPNPPVQKGKIR